MVKRRNRTKKSMRITALNKILREKSIERDNNDAGFSINMLPSKDALDIGRGIKRTKKQIKKKPQKKRRQSKRQPKRQPKRQSKRQRKR